MYQLHIALLSGHPADLQGLTNTGWMGDIDFWPGLGLHVPDLITYTSIGGLQLAPCEIYNRIFRDPRFRRHWPSTAQRQAAGRAHGPRGGVTHPAHGEYVVAAGGPDKERCYSIILIEQCGSLETLGKGRRALVKHLA